jgi:hypothetical protein
MGVNHIIATPIRLDHAFMGDGDLLPAMLSVRTQIPATHTIAPHSADNVWKIPDSIRRGGSGMYAAYIALHCMGFDHITLAGYDLAGGYFFDPTDIRGESSAHSSLVDHWRNNAGLFKGRTTALSGPLKEILA